MIAAGWKVLISRSDRTSARIVAFVRSAFDAADLADRAIRNGHAATIEPVRGIVIDIG